jgi:hypothetical protein
MVSPGDLHDYRLTAAAPGAWLVSAARSRCRRGGHLLGAPPLPVKLLPPEAILVWNQAEGAVISMLHVTC